jgi:hypothetical protein
LDFLFSLFSFLLSAFRFRLSAFAFRLKSRHLPSYNIQRSTRLKPFNLLRIIGMVHREGFYRTVFMVQYYG